MISCQTLGPSTYNVGEWWLNHSLDSRRSVKPSWCSLDERRAWWGGEVPIRSDSKGYTSLGHQRACFCHNHQPGSWPSVKPRITHCGYMCFLNLYNNPMRQGWNSLPFNTVGGVYLCHQNAPLVPWVKRSCLPWASGKQKILSLLSKCISEQPQQSYLTFEIGLSHM